MLSSATIESKPNAIFNSLSLGRQFFDSCVSKSFIIVFWNQVCPNVSYFADMALIGKFLMVILIGKVLILLFYSKSKLRANFSIKLCKSLQHPIATVKYKLRFESSIYRHSQLHLSIGPFDITYVLYNWVRCEGFFLICFWTNLRNKFCGSPIR